MPARTHSSNALNYMNNNSPASAYPSNVSPAHSPHTHTHSNVMMPRRVTIGNNSNNTKNASSSVLMSNSHAQNHAPTHRQLHHRPVMSSVVRNIPRANAPRAVRNIPNNRNV